MSKLKGACVVGQSGGPTAVINASILGAIQTALSNENITKVYAASHGITGVINDMLYDMGLEEPYELELLKNTPASAFGSCRYKMKHYTQDESDYVKILNTFKKYNVRYFFYNGGNDSMDTCLKISEYMDKSGYECCVIGIPKTIDNDLCGTDHCPGYGSAAKYVITSCMELYQDADVYEKGSVNIVEIMGRNAGWLTASSAMASKHGFGPDLIYLPEKPFIMDRFIDDVQSVYSKKNRCMVAISEGIRTEKGDYVLEQGGTNLLSIKDSFGHSQMGGLSSMLAYLLRKETKLKVRGIELSLLQRCAAHIASATDVKEAYEAGKAAVDYATQGISGKMVGFERTGEDEYKCNIKLFELKDVANHEKKIPEEWIYDHGAGLTGDFLRYLLPLIQGEAEQIFVNGLPRYAKLKKIKA